MVKKNIHHSRAETPSERTDSCSRTFGDNPPNKLQPVEGESYLGLTAGYGGHARAFLNRLDDCELQVLVDRDENAIKTLQAIWLKRRNFLILKIFVSAAQEDLVKRGRRI